MKNSSLVLTALLIVGGLAAGSRADVAPSPEYGRNIAPREETKVAMTAETVFIRLTPEKAFVRAVFHLENTGEATTLEVGFPDAVAPGSGSRDEGPQSVAWLFVHDFVAKVDGQAVEHRPRFLQRKDSPFEKPPPGKENQWLFAGWLIWDMTFERGQKHRVQVDYWVPYLRLADEEARRGWPGVAARLLARAAQCQEAAGLYTETIETCRLIIAFEKGGHASGARSWVMPSRGAHLPWECTLVRCLVKLGRLDEARLAAAEAFAAICAMPPWMKSSPGPRRDQLEASAKQLEAFAAGGPYLE